MSKAAVTEDKFSNVKDLYLTLTYYKKPVKGQKTHMKNWGQFGLWEQYEVPMVSNVLKKRHWSECSIIINITKGSVEKNNTEESNNQLFNKLVMRHSKQIAQFVAQYYPEIVDEFVKVLDKVESESPKEEKSNDELEIVVDGDKTNSPEKVEEITN